MQCASGTTRLQTAAGQQGSRLPVAFSSIPGSSTLSRSHSSCHSHIRQQRCSPASSTHTSSSSSSSRKTAVVCRAADDRTPPGGSSSSAGGLSTVKFNPVYLAIVGAYAGLLVFRNPYIYAVLTVVTILPQNSNVTSLNNLVLLFYESGMFQNFAEAVNCVRLVTWLSMGFMVASFAIFK